MPNHARSDEEIERCFDVMLELRTHLKRSKFLETIREMGAEGYKLAYIETDGDVVAVAGYRISCNLLMGKHLYVDDLVTAKTQRSRGHGDVLVSWLREIAVEQGCHYLHLDSGTHRHEAHKFYFRRGLKITSYHFSQQLMVE
ncbi:GNAT family N-acetyltransferase [Nitrospira sp. M1]